MVKKRGIKLTALRFQTGWRHQKSPASLQGTQRERQTHTDRASQQARDRDKDVEPEPEKSMRGRRRLSDRKTVK